MAFAGSPRPATTLTVALVLVGVAACAVDTSGLPEDDASLGFDSNDADLCPDDPNKTDPGECGCGEPDADSDGDGTVDCVDYCPADPNKAEPGDCGCGAPDLDADDDGSPSCLDCDDGDPRRAPTLTEVCGSGDNDCDGMIDEGLVCGPSGCADGSREGFTDLERYPSIAGCSGGWSIIGIFSDGNPSCAYQAGNDGAIPDGLGCDVDDLCAPDWHICGSTTEVATKSPDGCVGAIPAATTDPTLFIAAVAGEALHECEAVGTNGVFGCGNAGLVDVGIACTPLDRTMDRPCELFPGDTTWSCEGHRAAESSFIVKTGPDYGGVLCCGP